MSSGGAVWVEYTADTSLGHFSVGTCYADGYVTALSGERDGDGVSVSYSADGTSVEASDDLSEE